MIRTAVILAIAALASSCVTFRYEREIIEKRPDAALVGAFVVGTASLSEVLDVLGAPNDVWETARGGAACTWGGLLTREWDVDVSVPVTDAASASMSYTDTHAKTRGWLLLFGADDKLELVREGSLADLRRTYARRQPAAVDLDDPPAAPPPEPGP